MPALVVEHLSKHFGEHIAFDDVSFEVGDGEVFGFLGPNGAGKSTAVRTLGTLLSPSSGSATVAGIPLSAENGPTIRSRIAIMPEFPAFMPSTLSAFLPTLVIAYLVFGVFLAAMSLFAWRVVAAMFNCERLIAGRRT